MTRHSQIALIATVVFANMGCGGALESQSIADFKQIKKVEAPPSETPDFDGTLNAYLAFALKYSPEIRAGFERWRAATLRISRARRMPEPNISFGYFIRNVETRVGPQRFKVGVSQMFPWPTKLSAGANAMSEMSKGTGLAFDAEVLAVKRDVASAYWTLWLVHQEHRLKSEHDVVLDALAGAVRGRLQTGGATLADLNQIELNIARHHDHRGQHKEIERKASAMLLAKLGVVGMGQSLLAKDGPRSGLPSLADEEMRSMVRNHPHIERHDHLASSELHRAKSERSGRFPSFRLGVDFIETGDAMVAGVPDSGKDPLIVSAGISIPLWAGSYSDAEHAALASAKSHEAEKEATTRRAESLFETELSNVRDAQRRLGLYNRTLVPQAETTFQAVLGGYQTGRSTVAAMILAQRDLLDLQLEHVRAKAEHAKAWSRLEFIVGKDLDIKDAASQGTDDGQ